MRRRNNGGSLAPKADGRPGWRNGIESEVKKQEDPLVAICALFQCGLFSASLFFRLGLFFSIFDFFSCAPSTLNRNNVFKRRRRTPRWVFCSRAPFWDGS
jgi:hypothetical protein